MHRLSTVLIISLFSFAAFAAIGPGPERPVSSIVYDAPAGEQRPGAVTSDGHDFLSVWTDITAPRAGVYATRIPANGAVTVTSARQLRAGSAKDVGVCYANGGYIAVWSDVLTFSVYSARLNSDGSPIAGPRQIITGEAIDDLVTSPATAYPRGLACSNNGAVLVFKKNTPMVVTLDSNGVLASTPKKLPIGDDDVVSAASNGTSYFIATRSFDPSNVGIIRVSATGDVTDAAPAPVFAGVTATQIGLNFAGGRLGIAAVSSTTLRRAFIDPATLTVTKLPDVASGGQDVNVITFGNTLEAYVMNYNSSKIDVSRVPLRDNETTAPTPTNALHSETIGSSVSVASNGSNGLAVWKDFRRSTTAVDGDVFGAFLDTGLGPGTQFPVVVTARSQGPSAIASSSTESFVVWNERVGDAGKASLLGVRFDPKGVLLDTTPKVIASAVVATTPPTIAFDGTNYVVAWEESGQTQAGAVTSVAAQAYTKGGAAIGSQFRVEGPHSPAIGSNGSSALLVFTFPDGRGLTAVLMSNTNNQIALNTFGYATVVGAAGSDYLVAYTEGAETCQIICFPDKRDISGVRVSGNGTLLDATPIAIANGPKDQTFPHIASNGSDWLLVYNFQTDGLWSVGAKRLTHAGVLVDATASQDGVVIADDVGLSTAIARDDASYVVAYDAGNGADTTVLRLARTDDKGNVTERSGALGFGTRSVPTMPWLSRTPAGPVNISYSRFATEPVFGGTLRTFMRLMPDATPQPGKQRAARH